MSRLILDAGVTLGGAEVHPQLREDLDEQLAEESLKKFPRIVAGFRSTVPNFALTKKPGSRLDTRLIRQAALCIDKYRPTGKPRFPGRDVIILRLFEAAFGDTDRSPASIEKALQDRRKIVKGTAAQTATAAPTESC